MSPSSQKKQIFTGTFIHVPSLSAGISVLEDAVVGVDERGVIAFVERDVERLYEWDDEDDNTVDGLTRGMRNAVMRNGWNVRDLHQAVLSGRDGMGWWFPGFVGELRCSLMIVFLYWCSFDDRKREFRDGWSILRGLLLFSWFESDCVEDVCMKWKRFWMGEEKVV